MPAYYVTTPEEENRRLEQGSDVIRSYMDGKVFLAPIDTSRSGLKVLDSAASNGATFTPPPSPPLFFFVMKV